MIDIHSHILPGLDDGAISMEESIQMAKIAVEQGTRVMIATPHHLNGYDNRPAAIEAAASELKQELAARDIDLTVQTGQEVHISERILDEMLEGHLLVLANSRYLLIEFPVSRIPPNLVDVLHELRLRDYVPILVHPERNLEIIKRPEWLIQYIKAGGLVQITAQSLTLNRKLRNRCISLIRQQVVHFLGSDAHNTTTRPPGLKEAYDVITESIGDEMTAYLQQNAEFVLNNRELPPPPACKTKRIWKLFS